MPKKIDPILAKILREYDCDPATDIWDCHGQWIAYHRTVERIAAKAGIEYDRPAIIESNSASGVAVICVFGKLGAKSEWSFGEASPKNNKNAYPYAMAEKRAKDRVVLKLVGLHGLVYSEEEADDFQAARPTSASIGGAEANGTGSTPSDTKAANWIADAEIGIREQSGSPDEFKSWWADLVKTRPDMTEEQFSALKSKAMSKLADLKTGKAA